MDLKFLSGLLILVFPDGIFKNVVKKEAALKVFFSTAISVVALTTLAVFLFKTYKRPEIIITSHTLFSIIISVYCSIIIIGAALSWFFNWIYSISVERRGWPVGSNFVGNFLCHIYMMPFWGMLIFLYTSIVPKTMNIGWIVVMVFYTIRILDIEARLIKVVYKLRLIQGYTIVFSQLVLIGIGMGLGSFLVSLISQSSAG
ncbi:MAG: hypothetical protein GY853_10800 [PVC group bacterium]|nr:hypothetical protein [PVC group bacterium]